MMMKWCYVFVAFTETMAVDYHLPADNVEDNNNYVWYMHEQHIMIVAMVPPDVNDS